MSMLGMYNVQLGCIEGSEDPAGIFRKKPNVMSILSALSLLQLQGFDPTNDSDDGNGVSAWIIAFTVLFGLAVIFALRRFGVQHEPQIQQLEPDAEPDVLPPAASDLDAGEWCDKFETECSGTYTRGIHCLASRAVHFIASLQSAGSGSTGFSTNVDMVANALLRGIDRQADAAEEVSSEGSHVETMAEQRTRYMNSEQCEVSDPDLWMLLHYGEGAEFQSDAS
eukprot:s1782_g18.t1